MAKTVSFVMVQTMQREANVMNQQETEIPTLEEVRLERHGKEPLVAEGHSR